MAEELTADEAGPMASWPARDGQRRRSRVPRRAMLPPLAAIGFLTLGHFLYSAAQPMSSLFLSGCLVLCSAVSLLLNGPKHATTGMALGALAVWAFGALGWAGPLERAMPHLAVIFAAGAAWTVAYVCARQRRALDVAWAGLTWASLVYCAWMFFRHIAAAFAGGGYSGTFEGAFASPAEAALMFGALSLIGSARVLHVMKQIDAEAASRSEGVEKLFRDGLSGMLLLGFAGTCLLLSGSRVGIVATGGVALLHAWWDSRTLMRNADRGVIRKIIGRVAPFIALAMIGWAVWAAWMQPPAASLPGASDAPALQRAQAYLDAFLQKPAFGHGLGSIDEVRDQSMTLANARALSAPGGAQNAALSWLAQTGVAGALALVLALGAMHVALFRSLGSRQAPRTFLRLALASSLLLLVHGATVSSLGLPSLVWLYAFLLGAGCGVASWRRNDGSRASTAG